jgi:hypothetical protein
MLSAGSSRIVGKFVSANIYFTPRCLVHQKSCVQQRVCEESHHTSDESTIAFSSSQTLAVNAIAAVALPFVVDLIYFVPS